MLRTRSLLLATLGVVTLAGCSNKDADGDAGPQDSSAMAQAPEPAGVARVSSMELGRAVDSTRNITGGVTTSFGATDTLYLAVRTENTAPGAMVSARWMTASGTVIDSTAQAVASAAGSTMSMTAFHVSRATPWPAGTYRVEVFLDGVSQGIKEFEVRR